MSESEEAKSENVNPPGQAPATEPASGVAQSAANAPERRQSAWSSSYKALNYVLGLERNRLRIADKTSDILLGLAILMIVLLSFAPSESWQVPLALGCDFACLSIVFFFIGNRLGILRTLNEKQAVLVWDIVMGALILGVLLAINSMLLIKAILHGPTLM